MAASNRTPSEHRAVTITANDDGTYTATLYSSDSPDTPYKREHLETVTIDNTPISLDAGDRTLYTDINVTLEPTELHLTNI